jgi:hypothetical protein
MNNTSYALFSSSGMHLLRDSPVSRENSRKVRTRITGIHIAAGLDLRRLCPYLVTDGVYALGALCSEKEVYFVHSPRDPRPSSRMCDFR